MSEANTHLRFYAPQYKAPRAKYWRTHDKPGVLEIKKSDAENVVEAWREHYPGHEYRIVEYGLVVRKHHPVRSRKVTAKKKKTVKKKRVSKKKAKPLWQSYALQGCPCCGHSPCTADSHGRCRPY